MTKKKSYNLNVGYTTLLIFLMTLRYNHSRKVKLSIIREYPNTLIEFLIESVKNYNFTYINDIDSLERYINSNSDMFTIKDDYVYLNNNITQEDLDKKIGEYNYPFHNDAVELIKISRYLKNSMNLNSIYRKFKKQELFERKLLMYYLSYAYGKNQIGFKQLIAAHLESRNLFYQSIMQDDKNYIGDCASENTIYDGNNFTVALRIKTIIDYDKIFSESENTTIDVLDDPYLYAIFNEPSDPVKLRMYEDTNTLEFKYAYDASQLSDDEHRSKLDKIFNKELLRTGKVNYTPRERTKQLLFLGFIKSIDDIEEKYGKNEELEITKYKLCYLLDDAKSRLIEGNNLSIEYDKLYNQYLNEQQLEIESQYREINYVNKYDMMNDPYYFDWYQVLMLAFVIDIFENGIYDENQIYKKLALLKAYYSITEDEEIVNAFKQYSNDPRFGEYSEFVLNGGIKFLRR